MNKRLFFLLPAVLALPLALTAQTPAPTEPRTPPPSLATGKAHHIVIANPSSDSKDWEMAVGNARTLITYLKPDTVEVEIVSYSGGIDMLKLGSPVAADIAELQKMGVRFAACQRAMRGHNLELKDLVAGALPVPAGVVEVVLKQEQGWTYLKAGH